MMELRTLVLVALLAAGSVGIAGCEDNDGPAERAGEAVDDAGERAGEAVEDAGDAIEDRTQ